MPHSFSHLQDFDTSMCSSSSFNAAHGADSTFETATLKRFGFYCCNLRRSSAGARDELKALQIYQTAAPDCKPW
jgi:hypothetical protein